MMAPRDPLAAAFSALLLVVTFLLGSFTASTLLQSSFFRRRPVSYAIALFTETMLLVACVCALKAQRSPISADVRR